MYGMKCNEDLLVDYGFWLDDNEFERGLRYNIIVNSTDDIHAQIKSEMLKKMNITITAFNKSSAQVSYSL